MIGLRIFFKKYNVCLIHLIILFLKWQIYNVRVNFYIHACLTGESSNLPSNSFDFLKRFLILFPRAILFLTYNINFVLYFKNWQRSEVS